MVEFAHRVSNTFDFATSINSLNYGPATSTYLIGYSLSDSVSVLSFDENSGYAGYSNTKFDLGTGHANALKYHPTRHSLIVGGDYI